MKIQLYFIRLRRYYKEKGLIGTISHFFLFGLKNYILNKFILFYVDLANLKNSEIKLPKDYTIECKKNKYEISEKDINKIIANRGKEIAQYQLKKYFSKGAAIWLIKVKSEAAGFVWSISGKTIKPYFFPLTKSDAHLFDNEVFVEHRGQGINPVLIKYTLLELKRKGFVRAFIETPIWNKGEIRSLSKTYFQKYALARKFHVLGKNISLWKNI